MVSLNAKWRSMTGRRYTAPTVVSVDVEAYANRNPARENGIDRVEFTIYSGGDIYSSSVTSREWRFPNLSPWSTTKMPNVASIMAPVYGYGVSIDLSAYPAGSIRVTARAYARNGSFVDLPDQIYIYNDSDGGDRRPSTKQIYVNSSTGSDSNVGSVGSPVATIQKAITLCRKNTSGSTQADADCGGATIYLSDHAHIWGGVSYYDQTQWYTSGDWWLQIVSTSGLATISGVIDGAGTLYPQSYVFARGWNNTGSCKIQVSNCKFVDKCGSILVGDGLATSPVDARVWIDGGSSYTSVPLVSTNHSVLYVEKASEIIGMSNNLGKRYATGHHRHHVANGWHGWTLLMDCKLEHYSGIAIQATGNETTSVCNVFIDDQQAYNNPGGVSTEGYVWVADGARLSVTIPDVGLMRVTCNGTPATYQSGHTAAGFATQFQVLTGSVLTGVGFRRFPSASNNGVFRYISSGTDDLGNEYVTVANPNAVAQTGVGGSATTRTEMFTGMIATQLDYTNLHPDILQCNGAKSNCMFSNILVRNIRESQSWFTSGATQTNMWLVNLTDGGKPLVAYFSGSSLVDCGFVHLSFAGVWSFTGGSNYTGNFFDSCVINKSGGLPATGTNYVTHCHWVDTASFGADSVRGISPTSGAWFNGDPSVAPYYFTPAGGVMDSGSGLLTAPDIFKWPGSSGDTRGVWRNVGEYDFQGIDAPSAGTPAIATVTPVALSVSAITQSMGRGVLAGVQTLHSAILPQTVDVSSDVPVLVDALNMSVSALSQTATISVDASYDEQGTPEIHVGIVSHGVMIPVNVTNSVLTISTSILAATADIDRTAKYQFDSGLLIKSSLRAATASVFTPPTLGVLNLSVTAPSATVVKNVIGAATIPQSLSVDIVPQPQDTIAVASPVYISSTLRPATASGTTTANGDVLALSVAAIAQPQNTAANADALSLTVSALDQPVPGFVHADSGTPPKISSILFSAYGTGGGTVQADTQYLLSYLLGASATISTAPRATTQSLRITAPDQSASVAAHGDAQTQGILSTIFNLEATGSANSTNIPVYMSVSALDQGARSGVTALVDTQIIYIEAMQAQVSTDATAEADTSYVSIEILDQTAVFPVTVDSGEPAEMIVLLGSIEAGPIIEVTNSEALEISVYAYEASGITQSYTSPHADIPGGDTRERLNDEIPANPVPYEVWRIVES